MPVVASTVNTLDELATALLAVVETALGDTPGGVPDRVYVPAAPPAFDCCDFATVHVAALEYAPTSPASGVSGGMRTKYGGIILATLTITAVRCAASIPDGEELPSVDDMNAVGALVRADGWALWNHLRTAINDGDFGGLCDVREFSRGVPVPEQGGCVGWTFTLRAALDGYTPDLGS